jgi:hypothetical protein
MIAISTFEFGLYLLLAIGMGAMVGWNGNGDSAWRAPVPLLWWLPGLQLL